MRKTSAVSMLSFVLIACGGVPHPQIATVTRVNPGIAGGAAETTTVAYTYSGSHLAKTTEGASETTFVYAGDEIASATTGSRVETFTYTGGLISKVSLVAGATTLDEALTYRGGNVATATIQESSPSITTTLSYTYTNGKLTAADAVDGTVTTHSAYAYDSAGHLQSDTLSVSGGATTTTFTWDASGRVSTIAAGTFTTTVSYGANNLISGIARSDGSSVTYTYDSGSVAGYVASPAFSDGGFFAMDGRLLDHEDYFTSSLIL